MYRNAEQSPAPQHKAAVRPDTVDRRVSVAPMMGWTDRHDRYFLRLISPNALLYTVMITTGALIYGKK
ncbi:MAG: tRNA-dihydrouridine synthase, partial [Alphaproteobacteria bacterium]|nr:tRNA-dihydrouridine synthase [Alphaproteobacteria bacterium]